MTSSTQREPTYRRHFYFRRSSSLRFSIVFPFDFAADLVQRFACSSRSRLSIVANASTFLQEELAASLSHRFSRDLISGYHEEVFPKFSKYSSRLFFRDGESRECKCSSTVDYTRKIALDGPSTDVSAECMHSKCIGLRTHIRFLRGRQNVRHHKEKDVHSRSSLTRKQFSDIIPRCRFKSIITFLFTYKCLHKKNNMC